MAPELPLTPELPTAPDDPDDVETLDPELAPRPDEPDDPEDVEVPEEPDAASELADASAAVDEGELDPHAAMAITESAASAQSFGLSFTMTPWTREMGRKANRGQRAPDLRCMRIAELETSRKMHTAAGQWQPPLLLGVLDDRSRVSAKHHADRDERHRPDASRPGVPGSEHPRPPVGLAGVAVGPPPAMAQSRPSDHPPGP